MTNRGISDELFLGSGARLAFGPVDPKRRGYLVFLAVLVALVAVVWVVRPESTAKHAGNASGPQAAGRNPNGGGVLSPSPSGDAANPLPADIPIKHVVFMVKENRTCNNYFGTYGHGAVGSAYGRSMRHGDHIFLKPCYDQQPHDITHGFSSGLYSINGGKMNGYDIIGLGQDLTGYTTCHRKQIPAYWAYADRFVLADHFFTSMYGPTYPEHLYTVAAQSNRIVDNKSSTDHPGNYCDDPTEYSPHFRSGLSQTDITKINGKRFFRFRISMVANLITNQTATVNSLQFPYCF